MFRNMFRNMCWTEDAFRMNDRSFPTIDIGCGMIGRPAPINQFKEILNGLAQRVCFPEESHKSIPTDRPQPETRMGPVARPDAHTVEPTRC
jgi:hypothetical protein